MSLGRNDPCHCGSGKKYKKCCLQKDYSPPTPKALDFAYESFLALRRKATDKMGKILLESITEEEIEDFAEDYWNSAFLHEEEVEALRKHPAANEAQERQLPVALLNALDLGGRTPAEFMLEEHAGRFSAAELRFLRSFSEARLTYVQLREFHPEAGYAVVEDIFDGTRFNVYDKAVSTGGRIHDIVSARLVPFPEKHAHVMEPLALCAISPDKKGMLIEMLGWEAVDFARSHLEDTEEESLATPDEILELLKQDPMVFYWVDMRICHDNVFAPPPKLVTMDGEDIVFIKARFACPDPAALRSALLAQRNFRREDEEGAGEVFVWLNREEYVMGRLRIDSASGMAHLETNSRERLRKWLKKLRELGEATFLEKTETYPQELTADTPPDPGPAKGGIPPEEWKQLAPEIEKHLAEKWLKEKIPMLGGITPVQAARTPEGREKLRELFDYIENRSAGRSGPGSVGFDVDAMKQRLGLSED